MIHPNLGGGSLRVFLYGVIAIVLSLLIVNNVHGAEGINRQIPFHGTLYTSDGEPATSSYDITFALYTDEVGGVPEWEGTYLTEVTEGAFSVMLGSGVGKELTIDFTSDTYYLGITIEDDSEMSPRTRFGAAPYAFNADMLDGIDASSFLRDNALLSISSSTSSSLISLTQNAIDGGFMQFANTDGAVASVRGDGGIQAQYFESLLPDAQNTFMGMLNVLSGDTTYIQAGVSIGNGGGISFGDSNGISIQQDTDTVGNNTLLFAPQGIGAVGGFVQIATPQALWLTANNFDNCLSGCGPSLKLLETGGVQLSNTSFGDDADRYLDIDFTSGVQISNGDLSIINGHVNVAGIVTASELSVLNTASAVDLDVSRNTSLVDLAVSGNAHVTELTVDGLSTFGTFEVINGAIIAGPTTIDQATVGELIVSGTATVGNLDLLGTVSDLDVVGGIRASDLEDPINGLEEALYTDALGNIRRGIPAPPSDERLKKNIVTIDDALEKVLALRGVSYEWRDAERFGEQIEIGFIAQEIQDVIPDVVRPNGAFLGVKIQNVVAVVVEAIKELNANVEEYFTRTERLEREVAELRAEIELMKQGGNGDVTVPDSGSAEEEVADVAVEEAPQNLEKPPVVEEEIVPVPSEEIAL